MFRGETVTVLTPTSAGTDDLGATVPGTPTSETVDRVMVKDGPAKEPSENNRPDGVIVHHTLYFPKEYSGDLEGKEVEVRGRRCRVIGSPAVWPESPNGWYIECEVSRVEG